MHIDIVRTNDTYDQYVLMAGGSHGVKMITGDFRTKPLFTAGKDPHHTSLGHF